MTPLDLIPILFYLIALLWLGYRSRRNNRSDEEFLLSGRKLSIPAFAATLVTTWYGGILGVGEFTYNYGFSAWFVFGLPYYFFAILFAFFLAGKIRSSAAYSIPEMLQKNFDKKTAITGGLFILFMASPAPYILMLAALIQKMIDIHFYIALLFGTLFSLIYVWQGGFRSVIQTDKLQFLFMFSGFMVLFYILTFDVMPISEMFAKLDDVHLDVSGGLSWQEIMVWFLIASWTFIDPGFHQRCAAAKSASVAKKGILISVGFWFLFDILTISAGLYAFVLLPDIEPITAYPALASTYLPPFFKGLFFAGLFAIIMSTIDSYTFISGLTFGRDIVLNLKKSVPKESKKYVRIGLIFSAVSAIGMILLVPSVIDLWYYLGSLFIPPLLLPLLSAYFPIIQLSAKQTHQIMMAGFTLAFGLFLTKQLISIELYQLYFGGIEPFFPGLILTIALYSIGNWLKRHKLD
jgi:SSS family solute:Na+ symporter